MIITGLLGKVDIEAIFIDGNYGETIIPRAIRHGTSLSLAALYPEFREKLRLGKLIKMFKFFSTLFRKKFLLF